jgi:hypothetical protein
MSGSARASQMIANTRGSTSSATGEANGDNGEAAFRTCNSMLVESPEITRSHIPTMRIVMEMWSPVGQLANIKGIDRGCETFLLHTSAPSAYVESWWIHKNTPLEY